MEPSTLAAMTTVILIALGVHLYLTSRGMKVLSATLTRTSPEPSPTPDHAEPFRIIEERLRVMDSKVDACMKAVAEGIDHVDRNEKRVRGILTGAQRRFESAGYEDPGVEAEVESLPPVDAGSSSEEELPAVHEDVELGSWAAVPGMKTGV